MSVPKEHYKGPLSSVECDGVGLIVRGKPESVRRTIADGVVWLREHGCDPASSVDPWETVLLGREGEPVVIDVRSSWRVKGWRT